MTSMNAKRVAAMMLGPAIALAGLSACSNDDLPPGDGTGTGIHLGEADDADDDGGEVTGTKLDVLAGGTMNAGDGGSEDGCRKVDVVIAVDNSGSMSEELEALQGPVFDSLPQTLLSINGGIDDFHLAVIDACPKPPFFHDTGGPGFCGFSTGANYMSSGSPALADEYACVTTFSHHGYQGQADMCVDEGPFKDDDEQPGLTAAEAVSGPAIMGPNAGFLRKDALLFVVAITDEDEELADVASTQEIFDRLVAAKGGDVEQVVYLGIAGGSDCEGPYGSALDATQAQSLAGLFEAAGQGLFWDLCMGELEVAFQTAIEGSVDAACQDFVPQG